MMTLGYSIGNRDKVWAINSKNPQEDSSWYYHTQNVV